MFDLSRHPFNIEANEIFVFINMIYSIQVNLFKPQLTDQQSGSSNVAF